MEEETKKFDLPEILFMVSIVGLSDVGDVVGLISFPIPVVGQIIFAAAKIYSFVAWLGIQLWLIMKGERGLWFAVGSAVDLIGVPFAQTATLILTTYLANHPKVGKLATEAIAVAGAVAATAATAGAAAPAAGAAVAGAGAAEAGAATAGATAATAGGAAAAGEAAGAEAATAVGAQELGAAKTVSEEALGGEKSWIEQLKEPMENLPTPEEPASSQDKEKEVELDDENNAIDLKKTI